MRGELCKQYNMKTKKFKTDSEVVLNHPAINDCLVYDIETNSLDTENGDVKFFGCYSYKHKKYYMIKMDERNAIQTLIDDHKILIGFNNKMFDGPMMQNKINEFDLDYKICFDCMSVLYDYQRRRPNRESVIKHNGKILASILPNRKLKTIGEVLGFPVAKGDIDYKIFQKDKWTEDELKEIYIYLYKDIELTRMFFEFLVEYFEPFTEYVDAENIRKFNYIRSSLGSYTYSAICNLAEIEPIFEDDLEKLLLKPENDGGFVLEPQVEFAEGTIIYADFASLYPHIMFQCNLFSPQTKEEFKVGDFVWTGGDMFPDIKAKYKSDEPGKIEKVLKDIYMTRREYKKNKDPKELALKIMINTLYGISGSPIFKQLFNMTTAGDTTYIGRTMINYVRHQFEEQGYKVIYGDTDSIFIHLPKGKTLDDFQKIAAESIAEIHSNLPFPAETFVLDVDDIFNKVWLFKKKMYAGINHENKLTIKGLSIIKHDATHLGAKLLIKLKPMILEQQSIKFKKEYIEQLIDDEIKEDITIIARTYNVKSLDNYKSTSSIQAQISAEFGEGTHLLIPNSKIGNVGKSKKYATIDQAKGLEYKDLDLTKVYKELEPFIETYIK